MRVTNKGHFEALMCEQLEIDVKKVHSEERKRFFAAEFGCSVEAVELTWIMCTFPKRTKPRHLLWALTFLKTYGTEPAMAKKISCSRPTVRKYVWPIVYEISAKLGQVVSGVLGNCLSFFSSVRLQ